MGNLVAILKDARERIAQGAGVFATLDQLAKGEDFQVVVDLLQGIFLPTAATYEAAVSRYLASGSDIDAVAALRLSGLPGAHVQFWAWLEHPGRQSWTILEGFDRAILRSNRIGRS